MWELDCPAEPLSSIRPAYDLGINWASRGRADGVPVVHADVHLWAVGHHDLDKISES